MLAPAAADAYLRAEGQRKHMSFVLGEHGARGSKMRDGACIVRTGTSTSNNIGSTPIRIEVAGVNSFSSDVAKW